MKQKTKDNLIYLSAGLAIAAGFTIHMLYTERTTGRIQEIPGPILWGILSTPLIVALILERFWQYRHRRSVWLISIVAGAINVSAILVAYFLHWNPPAIIWSTVTVLGVILVFKLADK